MSRACGILLLMLLGSNVVFGQEPSPPPIAGAGTTEAGSVDSAEQSDSPADPNASGSLLQEHIIYIPFEKLREVFEKQDSSIVLPYAQFLEMWNRLTQGKPADVPLPVHGVISRAEYAGTVQGERVLLDVSLDIEALTAGWARIPVTFGEAAIGSAQSPDGTVLVRGVGEGQYELLVKGQGKHQVKLSLVIGVQTATEGRSITVQCPPVGVSNLELKIPERNLAVQVTPRRVLELREDIPDTTHVVATLGSTNQFVVSWQPKSGGTEQAAGLASVTDTIAVDVGDGVVHTHAAFDYEILRGTLPELTVDVPSDQRLLDVQAPGMRDWHVETVDNRQRVTARLHAPAMEKVRLEMRMETAITAEAFQLDAPGTRPFHLGPGDVRALGAQRR
ncbi:MAG: hypothetical protein FJ276_20485 [Planctomycetes bacterium]|nr:hypothetical protein [Planctomycetota bacterium]